MSKAMLSQLLHNVADLNDVTRLQVLQSAINGWPRLALDELADSTLSVNRNTPAWGALQIYLLHLAGQYAQANRVLDNMIGLNLSEQLTIQNCPTEDEIMARWEPGAQGVSVLCTTFNHARFIDMALASFFSQVSTHPFEVIVRDDASTDGTGALLKKWERQYPKILKVIRLGVNTYQQGQSPIRSIIRYATQPLMAFCEGDDFWIDSNKLHQQAELLERNPTWSAITHNHFELDEVNCQIYPGRSNKTKALLAKRDLVCVNLVVWIHTLMIRRELLDIPQNKRPKGVLGDQVLTSILGLAGPVFYIGDLFGSVARRNLFSTYTPLGESEKQRRRIITRRYLSEILAQRGDPQASKRLLRWCQLAEQQMTSA